MASPEGDVVIPIDQIDSMSVDKETGSLIIRTKPTPQEKPKAPVEIEPIRKPMLDSWWDSHMQTDNRSKAQIWRNETGANISTDAGERVEQISHFMAELQAGNKLEDSLRETEGIFEPIELAQKAYRESRRMEAMSGLRGWAASYTLHFIDILGVARNLDEREVAKLKDDVLPQLKKPN